MPDWDLTIGKKNWHKIVISWLDNGYRYHPKFPRLLIGIYLGTAKRHLIWNRQWAFFGTKNGSST